MLINSNIKDYPNPTLGNEYTDFQSFLPGVFKYGSISSLERRVTFSMSGTFPGGKASRIWLFIKVKTDYTRDSEGDFRH